MPDAATRSRTVSRLGLFVLDVLVYLAVLNVVEVVAPQVITETFAASVVTAVLLAVVLQVVVVIKDWLKGRVKAAPTNPRRVPWLLGLWLLLVGSKFVVLELVDLVFGDSVSLGGFWLVTALILLLMAARALVRRLIGASDGLA